MNSTNVEQLLSPVFPKKHIGAMIRHFERMTEDFLREEWEGCIAKGGKFIEAVLKALYVRAGRAAPAGKAFKVDPIINGLAGLAAGSVDDTVRLTIPRACRFVYEIASNRGGRHDPDEIDPNEMDANVVVMNCSWVLAEMIRHAQRGAVDTIAAKSIADSLVKRRYPLIEEVDGRTYFHFDKASAVEVALLALNHCYPKRMAPEDLIALLKRHDFSAGNARLALRRIRKLVDQDVDGRLRLLAPGLRKAEQVMNQTPPS